ncbi:MAG TPA: Ppx/GppA phosphatase family protein [Micropepsaceae bacterium]|nr:Ppx/GppA phosphatase family protein [Micropepsaceae bacterium]
MSLTDAQPRSSIRRGGRYQPFAVVDIGSNSVRLVIYEGPWRYAAALHNEKAICAIGRNMVSTGDLDEEGMKLALETLARFREICDGHNVRDTGAVATAAARDASNGREFIRRAEKALGRPIRILSGEEEARIAAEGTLAGIPDADGLVADLGGGSLDMVTVKDGKTGLAGTLPFGPLRLMDVAGANLNKARNTVEKGLDKLDFAKSLRGRALYAVGGIWRALAHVDMDERNYPLRVLHHYVIPAGRAVKLCRVVSGLSRKSLEKMRSVPKRRAEALPYGALVMEEMIHGFGLKEVVVSAFGLREGVLQRKLKPEEASKDPLIAFARDMNERESRLPGHAQELYRWMTPLFPKETPTMRRIREATCLFSDIGWRRHPDDRAMGAFIQVLRGAYGGADHHERAVMASAAYYRYAGYDDFPEETGVAGLLGEEDAIAAQQIGLAARLAFGLSGAVEGELPKLRLNLTRDSVMLEVPPSKRALLGETVQKRLGDLAESFGRKPQAAVG